MKLTLMAAGLPPADTLTPTWLAMVALRGFVTALSPPPREVQVWLDGKLIAAQRHPQGGGTEVVGVEIDAIPAADDNGEHHSVYECFREFALLNFWHRRRRWLRQHVLSSMRIPPRP